jgi:hypothetical protein
VGLTGSNLTVNFEPNTVERNGTAASQGRFSSAGGLAVLAGGTSVVNTTVTESTFDRNAGTDIQATVGDGPATQSSAQVVLNVNRSVLKNTQLSETDDGVLASGIRLNADAGTLVATIDSTVVLGDTTVLNSAFDRMEALYAIAEGTGRITATVSGTGINGLGRSGNEFVGYHVGVGGNALDNGVFDLTVSDTLIDAECVLKFHSGEFGDPAPSSLTASILRSELVARLPSDSTVDGIRAEALGGSDMSVSIIDSEYRFEGIVTGTTPARD